MIASILSYVTQKERATNYFSRTMEAFGCLLEKVLPETGKIGRKEVDEGRRER